MRIAARWLAALAAGLLAGRQGLALEPPQVRQVDGVAQLIVHGRPFLVLGGELGNSSAGTAAQADSVLPRLAGMHFNTVLMPVAWDEIEPQEGHLDFSVPDHWLDVARRQHLHLILLWFGSWKNAFSEYAPEWVLADSRRFPRAVGSDARPLGILSPLAQETARCDSRAFAALMAHLRDRDATEQTVLMVQVENEVGYLGLGGRDRSARANQLFQAPVPERLRSYLQAHRDQLAPELAGRFRPGARTWTEMFGEDADEAFMAWYYGSFVDRVARAGKAVYALPMYMNAQLPAPFERAGEYPSGGPHPLNQAVYRAAAPAIDFYAPDIYWPEFAQWVDRYRALGNPVFVPEARLDEAAGNALYTFGEARGFGFAPFGVDTLPAAAAHTAPGPGIADTYAVLEPLAQTVIEAQQQGRIRALVLQAADPRPSRTVSLDGYLLRATLARAWPSGAPAASSGAMMAVEERSNVLLILGSGLNVSFLRDPDAGGEIAGIAAIEQLRDGSDGWITERVLNGDQSDQGRALQMDPHTLQLYRVRLYTSPKSRGGLPLPE
ncbi:MAG TPA: DUF5597 domain-containing protein [Steroidobacteraceae bacterium]|nr:DUF5597 domain-containing protein [Steroidobacteraceae bacterium]